MPTKPSKLFATTRANKKPSLRLRTSVRAGDDNACLPCANCMYDCAIGQKENCVKKCAQQCGYPPSADSSSL